MVQSKDESLQYLEDMLRENMRLAQKNRIITTIGSLSIVAVFIVFGLFLYGRYSNFDVLELQGRVALQAPRALAPEIANFRNDLLQTLYPKLATEIKARAPEEMPKLREELEKQMVLLIDDTKGLMKKKITDDTTLVVRESIARGVENFHLTADQQQAVDRFAEESIELVLTDMQPFIENESQKAAEQLQGLYDTFFDLENSRLAQYIWPETPEDASIELFKTILEMVLIKLDDEDLRNFMKTDLRTNIHIPPGLYKGGTE